jgi:hypothetical protein
MRNRSARCPRSSGPATALMKFRPKAAPNRRGEARDVRGQILDVLGVIW